MKIKKLLPLVLIAVAAVLMLSSCDALLDAIFPTNQIFVDVAVDATSHSDYDSSSVTVVLSGPSSGSDTAYWDGYFDSYGYAHYYVNLTGLKDGTYEIDVFYNPTFGPAGGAGPYVITVPDSSDGHSTSVLIYIF